MSLGLGALAFGCAWRFGGPAFRSAPAFSQLLWVGVALLFLALQLVSLVAPLSPVTLCGIGAASVAGWYRSFPLFRGVRRTARGAGVVSAMIQLAVVVVVVLAVANSAMQPTDWYDTISTHLQQAKWSHAYPATIGLGNLNPKLGFDQAHHLLAAAMESGPFNHRAGHTAVPFLVATVALDWTLTLLRPARTDAERMAKAFVALTIPYLASKAWTSEIASLSGDLAMASVVLPSLRDLLVAGFRAPRRRLGWPLLVAGALAALLFAIKLSALPVLFAFAASVGWLVLGRRQSARFVLIVTAIPLLLVSTTIARRVVLTGWPLFPLPVLPLPVSWRIPTEVADSQYRWIKAWARMPRRGLSDVLDHGFLHWFVPWFEVFRKSREWILFVVSLGAGVLRTTTGHARDEGVRKTRFVLAVTAACVAYWFFGAPDLRFGGVFFWALIAVAMAPLVLARGRDVRLFCIVVALTWWNDGFAFKVVDSPAIPSDPKEPTAPRTFSNRDGARFDIDVPTNADLCGDAPLPCSPYFSTQQMREAGNLARGFAP